MIGRGATPIACGHQRRPAARAKNHGMGILLAEIGKAGCGGGRGDEPALCGLYGLASAMVARRLSSDTLRIVGRSLRSRMMVLAAGVCGIAGVLVGQQWSAAAESIRGHRSISTRPRLHLAHGGVSERLPRASGGRATGLSPNAWSWISPVRVKPRMKRSPISRRRSSFTLNHRAPPARLSSERSR